MTGYPIYLHITCIFIILHTIFFLTYYHVNVKVQHFCANRHLKDWVIMYVILYQILALFVVINDSRCVAHCGPSIDRQFNIPLLL